MNRWITAVVAALLLLAGCAQSGEPQRGGNGSQSSSNGAVSSVPDGLQRYYSQKVRWEACKYGECAKVTVPLDYANPGPDSQPTHDIQIAVKKTTPGKKSQGVVFVNPGGPGGSGVDAVSNLPERVIDRMTVVGFDPRGVSRSQPIDCLSDKDLGAVLDTKMPSDPAAAEKTSEQLNERIAAGCKKESGDLLKYVGTVNAAKDLDILRATIAKDKLIYVGYSYGTLLGSEYARQFPQNVGRMILDGAVDASRGNAQLTIDQTRGFEDSFGLFVDSCAKQEDCPLPKERKAALAKIRSLVDELNAHPVDGIDGRPLTGDQLLNGLVMAMYSTDMWEAARDGLTQVIEEHKGDQLLSLSDISMGRRDDGSFADNMVEANLAINCADYPPMTDAEEKSVVAATKDGPVIGDTLAISGDTCRHWPYHPKSVLGPYSDVKGIPPVVVVGNLHDPATPYAWAQALHTQLAGSILVTYQGAGHTAYMNGSLCIENVLNAYITRGRIPQEGISCPADEELPMG